MITDIHQLDLDKRYTYADYLTWRFDEMVELIRGRVVRMAPAPSRKHQRVSSNLHLRIGGFFLNKSSDCQIYHAPFDVRLPLPPHRVKDDQIDTVVQPDLCVICDREKLTDAGCLGAPDWIIEILSKSTGKKDVTDKFELYQHAGVGEYWIVHPYEETVAVYRLDETGVYRNYKDRIFSGEDILSPQAFPEMRIALADIFEEF